MDCNSQIHDELKNMDPEESTGPFCDRLLVEVDEVEAEKVIESCCREQDMENVNGMNVCINCGSVHGYDYVPEHVNFYENMYKIRRKSVYHRKYHIENVLNSICYRNRVQLTHNQRNRIYKVLAEIDSILYKINDGRKRMISIKFILKQLFKMLRLPYKDIQVTKSKKTVRYYKQYWEKVQLLIGDRIQSIISV